MRTWQLAAIPLALLAGFLLASACGGGGDEASPEPSQAAQDNAKVIATTHVQQMVEAADKGDMEAAMTHFDGAHDALHDMVDHMKMSNAQMSKDLDEATDDAEKDLESGEEAEHIVEVGNEILELLEKAE